MKVDYTGWRWSDPRICDEVSVAVHEMFDMRRREARDDTDRNERDIELLIDTVSELIGMLANKGVLTGDEVLKLIAPAPYSASIADDEQ